MSFSMQDLMGNQPGQQSQPNAPAASTPAAPAAAAPSTPQTPTTPGLAQAGPDTFKMSDLTGEQSQSTPAQPSADQVAAQKAEAEAAKKAELAKHGLIHRAWDWVNQPVFDNILPDGMKTADLVKAMAFEKMYGEAYIPGVNDFDTKAEVHLGAVGGNKKPTGADVAKQKQQLEQQKGVIRKFIEAHANDQSLARVLVDPEARQSAMAGLKTAANGMMRDTADTAAGFTSPLSLATLSLGEVGKAPGAVGKLARVASPLVGTAFGLQGAGQAAMGAYHVATEGATPENVQETLGGAGQAVLGATAPLHTAADLYHSAESRVRPVTKTIAGQDVPVRPTGALPEAVAKSVNPDVIKAAAEKTASTVQHGVGEVTKGAVGSEAETNVGDRDRFGIRAHADDLKQKAVPAFKELDRLSEGVFSDAQQDEKNSRLDFSTEGREKFNNARDMQNYIMEEHRDALRDAGYDVDEMKDNYRKQSALNGIADKLDTATNAREGGGYKVSGTKMANVIDALRREPAADNLFDKAGMTSDHVNALSELADTLRNEQKIPKVGTLSKLVAKGVAVALSGGHGISGLAEGLMGESAAEKIGSKIMTRMFGEAMQSEPAARQLTQAIKSGDPDALGKLDSFKKFARQLWQDERGEMGLPGSMPWEEPVKGTNQHGEDMEYRNTNSGASNLQHSVVTTDANGNKIGELAAQDTAPKEVTVRSNQVYDPAMRGAGRGPDQLRHLLSSVSDDTTRVKSDISTTGAARGAWEKLVKENPDAVTKKEYPGGQVQYSVDMDKWREGDNTPTPQTPGYAPDSEISTRPAGENNPKEHVTGWNAIEQAEAQKPGHLAKLLKEVQKYPELGVELTPEDIDDPRKGIEKVVNRWADNLEWLHNQIPAPIREISKLWYDSANKLANQWADQYAVPPEKVAGVIAALSPKNAWDINAGQARRMVDMYQNMRGHEWSPEMDKKFSEIRNGQNIKPDFRKELDTIRGKTFDELNDPENPQASNFSQALWMRILDQAHGNPMTELYAPDGSIRSHIKMSWGMPDPMAKALAILKSDGTPAAIHDLIGDGHKIRNFYNNIISPNSPNGHATIDTHAGNADMLVPRGSDDPEVRGIFGGAPANAATGQKGMYSLHHEAYRRAAARLDLLPRELQSITWEGVKALMGDEKKTPALRKAVSGIWQEHMAGDLTIDQARDKIVKAAGGFTRPPWMTGESNGTGNGNAGGNETGQSPANAGELPALGVSGQPSGQTGRGAGSRITGAIPAGTGAATAESVYEGVRKGVKKAKGVNPNQAVAIELPTQRQLTDILREHPLTQLRHSIKRAFVVGSTAAGKVNPGDLDVLLEVKGDPQELQQKYRSKLQKYFMDNNLSGVHDEVHPRWGTRRIDVYFTNDADADTLPKRELQK